MNITITVRPNIIHAVSSGEFSVEEASRTFAEVIASLAKDPRQKVLFDGRAIVGEPTLIQRFYYGEFGADAVRQLREKSKTDRNPQFAYILQEPVLDEHRFGETVAVNRGMYVRTFETVSAALEWLGLGPDEIEGQADGA